MKPASRGIQTDEAGREMEAQDSGEWAGINWTDSSWELARGLQVVEDLPVDAWPAEFWPPQRLPLSSTHDAPAQKN